MHADDLQQPYLEPLLQQRWVNGNDKIVQDSCEGEKEWSHSTYLIKCADSQIPRRRCEASGLCIKYMLLFIHFSGCMHLCFMQNIFSYSWAKYLYCNIIAIPCISASDSSTAVQGSELVGSSESKQFSLPLKLATRKSRTFSRRPNSIRYIGRYSTVQQFA